MKKVYVIDWNGDFEVKVEVDHAIMTDKILHEINNFWSEAESRLDDNDGDICVSVLKMLASVCMSEILQNQYTVEGIINQFDWDATFGQRGIEGWPKMDGSAGIKIVDVEEVCFFEEWMTVREENA